jgi:hypothetical protein
MRLIPVLLLCAALFSCAPKTVLSPFLDPVLENLVPSDTVFIVGANVDAIKNTPVYQKLLSRADLPQLNEFAKQTGLDPRKDLSQVISVSNGKTGLFMARGKFNAAQLEPRLEAQGATRFTYKGYKLFGNERGAVFFVNPSTAIAGPTARVRQLIDEHDLPGHGVPAALREQIRQLPATDQIWAALSGGLRALDLSILEDSNLGNVLRVFQGIEAARLGIDLRNGIDLQAEALCRSERDAKRVRDAVKGVVGLGRLSTPDNRPELLRLYDGIQADQNGSRAEVTARIAPDLVDGFLNLWLTKK